MGEGKVDPSGATRPPRTELTRVRPKISPPPLLQPTPPPQVLERSLIEGNVRIGHDPRIISTDEFLYDASGRYVWTQERKLEAWERGFALLEERIGACDELVLLVGIPGAGKSHFAMTFGDGKTLFFDGAMNERDSRARAIATAKQANKPVKLVWINSTLDECLARNARRPEGRRVPDAFLVTTWNRLQADPPTLDEGYSDLRIVRSFRPQERP